MQFKSFIFLAALTGLILAAGYYLGGQQGVVTALVISAVMNVGSYWFSDKLVLAIYRAHPLAPEQNLRVHQIVERIAEKTNLPKPKIYIVNMPAPNAFATGRNKNHAVVAVTPSILSLLNDKELEGVLAHELSHIQNYDIRLMTIVIVLVGMIALLSDWFLRLTFHGGGRRDSRDGRAGAVLMVIGIVLLILSPIIAQLIKLAVSRKREFLADASGSLLTRYPAGLANALEKISQEDMPVLRANNATAHLYLASPFGRKRHALASLFQTHPPIEQRIARLRSMA